MFLVETKSKEKMESYVSIIMLIKIRYPNNGFLIILRSYMQYEMITEIYSTIQVY